ncbi:DUF7882 family protein [Clavibacter capsici]|uniref:DUF7882 family protein n=1 Tax=Clavibacter capsici TaxID=1874630 RepID=UPI003FA1055B
MWLHPTCQIAFRFDGSRRPTINRAWVDELALIASTPSGLHLVPEPQEVSRPRSHSITAPSALLPHRPSPTSTRTGIPGRRSALTIPKKEPP